MLSPENPERLDMSNPPFCVDCTHRSKLLGSAMCNRPTGYVDLTTGSPEFMYKLCSIERMQPYRIQNVVCVETCDLDGKFFQQNNSVWYRIKKWISSICRG